MKKLFLLGLFLVTYGIGTAQDSIVPNRNLQNNQQTVPSGSTIQNQQTTPVTPKAPDQPTAPVPLNQVTVPNQSNLPNTVPQSTLPNQSTIPTPTTVPNQTNIPNPTIVPNQSTVPNQQSVPNQATVPNQTALPNQSPVTIQPTVPVEVPVQSNVPDKQNSPIQKNINPNQQYRGNYNQMADVPRIGGKVVRFTFIASPQIAWMSSGSREVRDSKSKFGFAYGIEGDVFLASDRYSFLTGLVISSVGGTLAYKVPILFSGVNLPADTKVEYFLRYLEIPLAIKLRSKDFNNMRFFAQFGLNTWMNIKAKASTSDGSFNKEVVGDEVRFFNLGLNVGGGVEYDLGDKNSLTAGIVYSGSFNDSTNNATVSDKTTINSLRIRLGFIF